MVVFFDHWKFYTSPAYISYFNIEIEEEEKAL